MTISLQWKTDHDLDREPIDILPMQRKIFFCLKKKSSFCILPYSALLLRHLYSRFGQWLTFQTSHFYLKINFTYRSARLPLVSYDSVMSASFYYALNPAEYDKLQNLLFKFWKRHSSLFLGLCKCQLPGHPGHNLLPTYNNIVVKTSQARTWSGKSYSHTEILNQCVVENPGLGCWQPGWGEFT